MFSVGKLLSKTTEILKKFKNQMNFTPVTIKKRSSIDNSSTVYLSKATKLKVNLSNLKMERIQNVHSGSIWTTLRTKKNASYHFYQ